MRILSICAFDMTGCEEKETRECGKRERIYESVADDDGTVIQKVAILFLGQQTLKLSNIKQFAVVTWW